MNKGYGKIWDVHLTLKTIDGHIVYDKRLFYEIAPDYGIKNIFETLPKIYIIKNDLQSLYIHEDVITKKNIANPVLTNTISHVSAKIDSCIKGDCENGYGVFHFKNGDKYIGMFKNGNRHYKGLHIFSDGDIYDGEWRNNLQHGTGIQTINGDSMQAEFDQGKYNYPNLIGNNSFSLSEKQSKFPNHIIISTDSSSAKENYNKVLHWLTVPSFDNQKIILQKENKNIQIEFLNKVVINNQKFDIRCFIDFKFKSNRVKFDILDAEIYLPDEIESKINWLGLLIGATLPSISEGYISTITPLTVEKNIPGQWVKLHFKYSDFNKNENIDEVNTIVQTINGFTIMARDIAHYLNTPIESDDW